MKKLTSLTLALTMIFTLAGCGALAGRSGGRGSGSLPDLSLPGFSFAPAEDTPAAPPVETPPAPSILPAVETPAITPPPAEDTPAPVWGPASDDPREALLRYVNEDLLEIAVLEAETLDSYGSVTGENYTDDQTTYNEFTRNTIPLARQLNTAALDLATRIQDPELNQVHSEYVDYTSKFLSALGIMVDALTQQSFSIMSDANEKLNEANQTVLSYQRDLRALAAARGVELGG